MKTLKKKLVLKTKYSILLIVLSLVSTFIIVLGVSYAYFTSTVKAKEFVIYTGNLAVDYSKKTDVINVENLYPMTNTEGLNLTPHEFTVSNNGNIDARYQVRLEVDNNLKDLIPIEYIKFSYSIDGSAYSEPVLLSNLDSSLAFVRNIVIEPEQSNTFGIKLWIDINAPNEIQGKTFKARVVVDSIQDVEDGYVVDATPTIYLNKDENGNQDIILNTNETYNELGISKITDDKDKLSKSNITTTYEYFDGTNTTTVYGIDTTKTGIYYITYSITDYDNNTGKAVRIVAVGDDKSLKIYKDINSVINSFDSSNLKEAVMCSYIDGDSRLYFDCKIHDTVENAINSKTKGIIILTSDINKQIYISRYKEIVFELNGHDISSDTSALAVDNAKINIQDQTKEGYLYAKTKQAISLGYDAKIEIDYVNIKRLDTTETITTNTAIWFSSNCNGCKLTINDANIEDNTGTIIDQSSSGINTNITINNGYFHSYKQTIINNANSTININGGTYISDNSTVFLNKTGTLNISDSSNKVYAYTNQNNVIMAGTDDETNTDIKINIKGNRAYKTTNGSTTYDKDACTNNPEDLTGGICLYSNSGNGILSYYSNLTIDGATLISRYISYYQVRKGTANINDTYIYTFGDSCDITDTARCSTIRNHYNDSNITITNSEITNEYYDTIYTESTSNTNVLNSKLTSLGIYAVRHKASGNLNLTNTDIHTGNTVTMELIGTGTVTIDGGKYTCTDTAEPCKNFAIKNSKLKILDGEFISSHNLIEADNANIYISGGSFKSTTEYAFRGTLKIGINTNVYVSGGTFDNPNGGSFVTFQGDSGPSNLYLCNANIISGKDYYNINGIDGYLYYSSNVKFANGTNTPTGTGSLLSPNYTGTCPTE